VQIRREDWTNLNPDDVAWVTEWQLAAGFRWLPLEGESQVRAAPIPEPDGRFWPVQVRVGGQVVQARLPVRDLAKAIRWCHSIHDERRLFRPPRWLTPALASIRAGLRAALRQQDPLATMGYASYPASDPDRTA
jgi:hypothetical protein